MSYRLSIITINYNDADGLKKTFESVFSQKSAEFEYIVVDGNSNDGSLKLIQENQGMINSYRSEPDSGVYSAMNKGIKMASGKFLLFLNSGDRLAADDIISKILQQLDNHSDIISGNLIFSVKGKPVSMFLAPKKVSLTFFLNSFLPHPSSFIRRELLLKTEGFNEKYSIISDWEFFLKAIVIHGARYRALNIAVSDFDNSGISSKTENLEKINTEKEQVYQALFPNMAAEIELLKFAGTRRFRQFLHIRKNNPFQWRLLKGLMNVLNAFNPMKEEKSTRKL